MRVAILGGGHGGTAMAADLTFKGHEVSLLELPEFSKTLEPIIKQNGIKITGETSSGKEGIVMPKRVTTKPKEAIDDAEIIMTAVPAVGHEAFIKAIAPHLRDGQILVVNTGYWASLRFRKIFEDLRKKGKEVIIAESELLVYLCRSLGPGQIHIDATKNELNFAAMPSKYNQIVLTAVRQLYPQYKEADSILNINFYNLNPFIHTAITLLSTARIENLGSTPFLYYGEGTTKRVCKVIEEVDKEKMAVANALGLKIESVLERLIGMYSHVGASGNNLFDAFKSDRAAQAFLFDPPGFSFVLAEEDLPYGLIPVISLGEQFGINMPVMRALVLLHCIINEKDYWTKGATVEKLGLAGMSSKEILEYVHEGNNK
jgi:opine dehydrogenase